MPRSNERRKELKQRRRRSKKLVVLKRQLESATPSGQAAIADKIRAITPGAADILRSLEPEK